MISIKVNVQVDDRVIATAGRQVPFAMSQAINESVKKAQTRQKSRMRSMFTIRRPGFLNLAVKITRFSKRDTLVGEIAISPPGDRADVFAKFEDGGKKRPTSGHSIAVPVTGSPVKRQRRSIVQPQNKPRALLSGAQSGTAKRSAFRRPAENGKAGAIFVRQGKRLRLAYTLQESTPIDERLKFEETVSREVRKTFDGEFAAAFTKAMRTAR